MGNCQSPGDEAQPQPHTRSPVVHRVQKAARNSAIRRRSTDPQHQTSAVAQQKKPPKALAKQHPFDPTLSFITKRRYTQHQINRNTVFSVDERYYNLKKIGSGAYGVVCKAVDRITGQKVAIKKVADVFADLVDAKRILREIRILIHLGDHKNVVGLLDVMVGPHTSGRFEDLYLVFGLFDGDLDRAVGLPQLTSGHIQFFLYQILKGMLFVHSAGIIHRDLKPPNILINANNDLAICDFGLARGLQIDNQDATEYVVTRWYRAPELLCGNSHYTTKIDVWSIGLIFAELLMGKTVLRGQNYFDQLQKSMALVGKPSGEGALDWVESAAARRVCKVFSSQHQSQRLAWI